MKTKVLVVNLGGELLKNTKKEERKNWKKKQNNFTYLRILITSPKA